MWSRSNSVVLSQICTWIVITLAAMLAIALPYLCVGGFFNGRALISQESIFWLMPIYYSFCVPSFFALFTLNRLLASVKRESIFTNENVKALRKISWCCVAAAMILLASSLVSVVFFALAILAAFFAVILRTVKNLFAAAVALKAENDLTI